MRPRGRHLARTLALQALFELESRPSLTVEDTLARRRADMEEESGERLDGDVLRFAKRLVEGALAHRQEIDARIGRVAPAFPVHQMPITDRVALELAMYELTGERSTPVKVVINEAVELAKTYGGENSGRFVNGVLGTIAEELSEEDRHATAQALQDANSPTRKSTDNTTRR